ncbi:MAG: hypothetical protein GWP09_01420 [Nitrospiraceae bacterium]|nr:hypothetical protein [Nitrospiraceae bacterium]
MNQSIDKRAMKKRLIGVILATIVILVIFFAGPSNAVNLSMSFSDGQTTKTVTGSQSVDFNSSVHFNVNERIPLNRVGVYVSKGSNNFANAERCYFYLNGTLLPNQPSICSNVHLNSKFISSNAYTQGVQYGYGYGYNGASYGYYNYTGYGYGYGYDHTVGGNSVSFGFKWVTPTVSSDTNYYVWSAVIMSDNKTFVSQYPIELTVKPSTPGGSSGGSSGGIVGGGAVSSSPTPTPVPNASTVIPPESLKNVLSGLGFKGNVSNYVINNVISHNTTSPAFDSVVDEVSSVAKSTNATSAINDIQRRYSEHQFVDIETTKTVNLLKVVDPETNEESYVYKVTLTVHFNGNYKQTVIVDTVPQDIASSENDILLLDHYSRILQANPIMIMWDVPAVSSDTLQLTYFIKYHGNDALGDEQKLVNSPMVSVAQKLLVTTQPSATPTVSTNATTTTPKPSPTQSAENGKETKNNSTVLWEIIAGILIALGVIFFLVYYYASKSKKNTKKVETVIESELKKDESEISELISEEEKKESKKNEPKHKGKEEHKEHKEHGEHKEHKEHEEHKKDGEHHHTSEHHSNEKEKSEHKEHSEHKK